MVHFSSGQGLQPETKTTGSQRPRPRPAVNLSVQGHRFQCQLPGVGDATGGLRESVFFFEFFCLLWMTFFLRSLPNDY